MATWGLWQGKQIWNAVSAEVPEGAAPAAIAADQENAGTTATTQRETLAGWEGMRPTFDGVELAMDPPADGAGRHTDELPEAGPVYDATHTAEELRAEGLRMLNAGETVSARYALNAALARTTDEGMAQGLREALKGINAAVFLGSEILPDDRAARLVEILPGDSFVKLGHVFAVPAELLQAINPALKAKDLRPLKGLKIVEGPFHLQVVKHAARMDVFARTMYVTSFSVQFPEGNSLPVGEYRIADEGKITLTKPTRQWIGFIGAEPATEAVTAGWIFGATGPRGGSMKDRETGMRLADSDLASLYNEVVEGKSHLRVER